MPSPIWDASTLCRRPGTPAGSCAIAASVAACVLAILLNGCASRNAHAAAPITAAPAARPIPETNAPPSTPPPPVKSQPASQVPIPEAEAAPAEPPKPPAPPRKQNADNAPPARPPAPQIAPQMSADDQAAYERKTNENIESAQKNLQTANGRTLTAGQSDLVEKIKGFLTQSREAISASDWARASNLSQKAYLLSVELVNSW